MKNRIIYRLFLGGIFVFLFSNFSLAQQDTIAPDKEEVNKEKVIEAPVVKEESNKNGFLNNWFFGIKGGATFFLSPLKEQPFSWGASATLGKQLNRKVAIRADYLYGNLMSQGNFERVMPDGSYYKNDLNLNVDFMEIALLMKLNINDFFYSRSPKHLRELYVFGGGAYTMFRSEVTDKNGDFVMGSGFDENGDQEAMDYAIVVPLGVGVSYKLDKKDLFSLNAEFGYRFNQEGVLDGGLSGSLSSYTFSSLGLLVNLGKPTLSPQKITSDLVREEVEKEVSSKVDKKLDNTIKTNINPVKDDLKQQSAQVVKNQEQLQILQEELESRTNAFKEQMAEGSSHSGGGTGSMDMTSIYFAFNSTYVTPAMEREVAVIAKILKRNKNLSCEVIGNSSNIGSPEYNMQLSQKRAEAVYNLLVEEFKIDESRLTLTNKGLDEPLAENIKRINRRVDLILK